MVWIHLLGVRCATVVSCLGLCRRIHRQRLASASVSLRLLRHLSHSCCRKHWFWNRKHKNMFNVSMTTEKIHIKRGIFRDSETAQLIKTNMHCRLVLGAGQAAWRWNFKKITRFIFFQHFHLTSQQKCKEMDSQRGKDGKASKQGKENRPITNLGEWV